MLEMLEMLDMSTPEVPKWPLPKVRGSCTTVILVQAGSGRLPGFPMCSM